MKKLFDKMRPKFEKGGKLHMLHSVFDGFETFMLVPNTTAHRGEVHVHDAMDSKRIMSIVVISLVPAMLFGMYNVGLQHFMAHGLANTTHWFSMFIYGLLAILPKIIVSYVVGLGIEFAVAQVKGHEIAEGFLVTGFLIPMIVPVDTPLWTIAIATAFAVVFAKELFGGTGYNVFNIALVARVFLFFAYPTKMSGDTVFVRTNTSFGFGSSTNLVDSYSGATPLGQIATAGNTMPQVHNILGEPLTYWDAFWGFIPGSIGEVSTFCILLGALLLIITGVGSYKIMLSGLLGSLLMSLLFNAIGTTSSMQMHFLDHVLYGGFLFGLVFMATDPVTATRTETGKWFYGFFIGVMCVFIRVLNPGYPEGMMLAILLMNVFAPLIDYFVIDANIRMRKKRLANAKKSIIVN